ncbi:methylated-DNA--[protein]-cysteine S-methyltransferase [Streptomyces sp. 549]|uniref:methylated-DNA--[protein]-cysteine S-methyltransferase n=1 Tax=Streptomyces sp. 549 TaxID=3049076 RepID=UPI0032E35E01
MLYTHCPSPLGDLLLAGPEPGVLASVTMPGQRRGAVVGPGWVRDDAAHRDAVEQFDAYFAGGSSGFSLRLAPQGTEFRRRVWDALDSIPYGCTVTYGELAVLAGAPPAAVRAVGGAVGANPLLVVRPCHRVLGAGGALTGFAGGLPAKRALLEIEGVLLPATGTATGTATAGDTATGTGSGFASGSVAVTASRGRAADVPRAV